MSKFSVSFVLFKIFIRTADDHFNKIKKISKDIVQYCLNNIFFLC